MMDCCRNKTTPHCDQCGADLEAKSLVGLKKYLESRLQSARDRLAKWVNATAGDEEKVKQGIARSTDTIIQMDSWGGLITDAMDPTPKPPPRRAD